MKTKYDKLIALIEPLKKDKIGDWKIDNNHAGTKDDPMPFPFPIYTEVVNTLIHEIYEFERLNPDFELTKYNQLLQERGLEWNSRSLENADVSNMDAQGIMAMLMGLTRGERFCDGAILSACKCGAVLRWLERLEELAIQDNE